MGIEVELIQGQEVRITANTQSQTEMSDAKFLEYFQEIMKEAASESPFKLEHNSDLSTDYKRSDIQVSKDRGANYRASLKAEDEDYVILHIGDKPGDMIKGENAIFFDQENMPAQGYTDENNIKSITVDNAAEYSLVIAELFIRKNRQIN